MDTKNRTVVMLGMPSFDSVLAHTTFDIVALVAVSWNAGIVVHTSNQQGEPVGPSRCTIVDAAIELKDKDIDVDYIFFVDSDMRVPADALIRLLGHRKDIVGANYVKRRPPHRPIITKDVNGKPLRYDKDALVNVGELPTGCMLIRMNVFAKMEKPYFAVLPHKGSNDYLGEDLFFCRNARDLGYRVYCDTKLSLEVGHSSVTDHYIKT